MSASFQHGVSCPYGIWNTRKLLTSFTAPADVSVRYGHVRYNITTKENRFVGAGPEVDEAWREISYDSEYLHGAACWLDLTRYQSGRPVAFEIRPLEARHARDFSQSQPSHHRRGGV